MNYVQWALVTKGAALHREYPLHIIRVPLIYWIKHQHPESHSHKCVWILCHKYLKSEKKCLWTIRKINIKALFPIQHFRENNFQLKNEQKKSERKILFPERKFKFALEKKQKRVEALNAKWHWNIQIESRDVCKGFRSTQRCDKKAVKWQIGGKCAFTQDKWLLLPRLMIWWKMSSLSDLGWASTGFSGNY